jgi:tetratricopeptide (TPR) repeat protein
MQRLYRTGLPLEKPLTEEELFTCAHRQFARGMYAQAARSFADLVLRAPTCWEAWRRLAQAEYKQRNYARAAYVWEWLGQVDSSQAVEACVAAAECHMTLNNIQQALVCLAHAEQIPHGQHPSGAMHTRIALLREVLCSW